MPQPLLSAILIVKNEEKNLPRCLASLRGVVEDRGHRHRLDKSHFCLEFFALKVAHLI